MSETFETKVLRGDILKTLYYRNAFNERTQLGAHLLWLHMTAGGHHEDGEPLTRDALERHVDSLAAKGLVGKIVPPPEGRLLTDYEAYLTRKGRGLLEGALPEDPDVLIGDL
ncbi:MAG: hypothetical protein A3F84_10410 [Candidatus Handelsmanbacteria bacterium RIFCSPLOWO2_12_FULL_64_10]|uniref:Uncharacterized protein n=1 Tax=Handelsmanbacteria sp. (strain RIFCSPLOWO2_12_FULL_64_10) TaxID=1817868 RepID=A0A1F6CAI2_HANXR|nr:MAG: hypothetical protein A3F84_10410 [Candidatus Handelsmanbacteria bacterium RIFCSPLOWO2_12_FULL_64_10]